MKKISLDFRNATKMKNVRKEFINFTKNIWIQEVTEDESGTLFSYRIRECLGLEQLYNEVKNKYDVLYKELNIERNRNLTIVISVVLVASLIFNILNFMLLAR